MKQLLCLGFGYSASALARRLTADGWKITGTSTTESGAAQIRATGYDGIVFDGTQPSDLVRAAIRAASHIVISTPPSAAGDPVLAHHAEDLAESDGLRWIGYLSTVGVYGDADGGWVDEDSPLAPTSQRSVRRKEAEDAWIGLGQRSCKPVGVFRLAGIYGPGRSAIDNLKDGNARRVIKPRQVFNRIHVDDIAATVVAAIHYPDASGIFNVTDDEPSPPQDVIAFAANLLGVPMPPEIVYEEAELSPMVRSFYAENKRVRNTRIKSDLGVRLAYPTYREGIAAIAASSA